eukprot:gene10493-3014_t
MSWFGFGGNDAKKTEQEDPLRQFLLSDKTKYEIPSTELFEKFKVVVLSKENDGWSQKLNEENLKVWTKESSNSKVNMLKVSVDFDVEASYFHQMIKDDHFFLKASTGDLFSNWKLIKQIDDNNIISYFSFKSPVGIMSGRDFVALKSYNATDTDFVTLIRSVEIDEVPQHESLVRADIHITGYYFYPIEKGKCRMMYLTQTDLNGYIPGWLLNLGATTMAKQTLEKMNKMCTLYPDYLTEKEEIKKE